MMLMHEIHAFELWIEKNSGWNSSGLKSPYDLSRAKNCDDHRLKKKMKYVIFETSH